MLSQKEVAHRRLDGDRYALAVKKLRVAAAIQFTVYGVPSVYYGDEAGVEGYRDPFCRMPYPWGREDTELVEYYRNLGKIRADYRNVFAEGEFKVIDFTDALIAYTRRYGGDEICVIANASNLDAEYALSGKWYSLVDNKRFDGKIAAYSAVILKRG